MVCRLTRRCCGRLPSLAPLGLAFAAERRYVGHTPSLCTSRQDHCGERRERERADPCRRAPAGGVGAARALCPDPDLPRSSGGDLHRSSPRRSRRLRLPPQRFFPITDSAATIPLHAPASQTPSLPFALLVLGRAPRGGALLSADSSHSHASCAAADLSWDLWLLDASPLAPSGACPDIPDPDIPDQIRASANPELARLSPPAAWCPTRRCTRRRSQSALRASLDAAGERRYVVQPAETTVSRPRSGQRRRGRYCPPVAAASLVTPRDPRPVLALRRCHYRGT